MLHSLLLLLLLLLLPAATLAQWASCSLQWQCHCQ
jgi:hypothetical protein